MPFYYEFVSKVDKQAMEMKKVFVEGFMSNRLYAGREAFLQEVAKEEVDTLNKSHGSRIVGIAYNEHHKMVGFIIFDLQNYPQSIYLAQGAMLPDYQHQGIGKELCKQFLQMYHQLICAIVLTRHGNELARGVFARANFQAYEKIFTEFPFLTNLGYSSENYRGFKIGADAIQGMFPDITIKPCGEPHITELQKSLRALWESKRALASQRPIFDLEKYEKLTRSPRGLSRKQ